MPTMLHNDVSNFMGIMVKRQTYLYNFYFFFHWFIVLFLKYAGLKNLDSKRGEGFIVFTVFFFSVINFPGSRIIPIFT